MQFFGGEFVDALTVDFDGGEPSKSSQALQPAGNVHKRTNVGPVDEVGIEMAVLVPARDIAPQMSGQRFVPRRRPMVGRKLQAKGNTGGASSIGEEGQVEPSTVPRRDNPGFELGDCRVEIGEDLVLFAIEYLRPPVARQRNGDYRGRPRVEASQCGIGFDIERIDLRRGRCEGVDAPTLAEDHDRPYSLSVIRS